MMDAATSGKTWPAPTAVEVGQVRQVQVDVCGVTEGAVCVCVCAVLDEPDCRGKSS